MSFERPRFNPEKEIEENNLLKQRLDKFQNMIENNKELANLEVPLKRVIETLRDLISNQNSGQKEKELVTRAIEELGSQEENVVSFQNRYNESYQAASDKESVSRTQLDYAIRAFNLAFARIENRLVGEGYLDIGENEMLKNDKNFPNDDRQFV